MTNALKTLTVAFLLCVVCSIMVSTTAVQLKPTQQKNKELDVKKNILLAGGLINEGDDIEEAFKKVEIAVYDFETGEKVEGVNPSEYDPYQAEKVSDTRVKIPADKDIAGLSYRAKYAKVYLTRNAEGQVDRIILPVKGKGLWSTMYGFLALEGDANTVAGFGYYEQGETPGLGAEVNNPKWKNQWKGIHLLNSEGDPIFEVKRGADGKSSVDALSGATITGKGVQSSTNYWMGEHGYAKILEHLRTEKL